MQEYVENLGMYLERKLYVFNCGHAANCIFWFIVINCETIHDALEVPEIKADVVAVMKKSAMAITKRVSILKLKKSNFISKKS